MSIPYRCRDCGATVRRAIERSGERHRCPQCDGPLIEQPAAQKSGMIVLVAILATVGAIMALAGLAAVVWLFARFDAPPNGGPPVGGPQVLAVADEPPPFVGPFDKGEPKQVRDPKKEALNKIEPPFTDEALLRRWPATPKAIPITPTKATDDTTLPLGNAVERMVVGGGGRYLLLPSVAGKKLFIVDVCDAKIIKEMAWPAEALLAATMHKFFALNSNTGQIQRYDLATATLESTKPFNSKGLSAFTAGHSSAGPLLIRNDDGAKLYDSTDYSELVIDPRLFKQQGNRAVLPLLDGDVAMSGDGRTIVSRSRDNGPLNIASMRIEDGRVLRTARPHQAYYLAPDASGHVVCVGGHQPVSHLLSTSLYFKASGLDLDRRANAPQADALWLPGAHGMFHMKLTPSPAGRVMLTVYAYEGDQAIAHIVLDHLTWPIIEARQRERLPSRIQFIPQAAVTAYLSPTGDNLHLTTVNLEREFASQKINRITILSTHPQTYQPGTEFRYPLIARSKLGVRHSIEGAPKGMTINPETGLITWPVPADHQAPVRIMLMLRNGGGEISLHHFTMTAER